MSDLDPRRVAAELQRRFPGVCAWRGDFTGSWWALARGRDGRYHLVEAPTPAALARRLAELAALPPIGRTAVSPVSAGGANPRRGSRVIAARP